MHQKSSQKGPHAESLSEGLNLKSYLWEEGVQHSCIYAGAPSLLILWISNPQLAIITYSLLI